ncbi:MAG: hypothetical protein IKC58_03305 [Clostridia bacterium]|nr:hypothetical protein [Clostridia bacterium]MBR2985606.1 hypothetical protein [Clostridia bacterium]
MNLNKYNFDNTKHLKIGINLANFALLFDTNFEGKHTNFTTNFTFDFAPFFSKNFDNFPLEKHQILGKFWLLFCCGFVPLLVEILMVFSTQKCWILLWFWVNFSLNF